MIIVSPLLVDAVTAAQRHSSGRSFIPLDAPEPAELEWHHVTPTARYDHVILFRGPTGELRLITLEDWDIFPCDIDSEDELRQLWRMWRRAAKVPLQYKIRLTKLLVRLRDEAVEAA